MLNRCTRCIFLPDLRLFLDLVGLATICDVVPLKDVNRAFVRFGLGQLSTLSRPGLAALFSLSWCISLEEPSPHVRGIPPVTRDSGGVTRKSYDSTTR